MFPRIGNSSMPQGMPKARHIYHHVAQIQAASSTPVRNLRPYPDIRPHLAREIERGTQQAVEHEMGRISGLHDVRIVLVLLYDRHKLVIQFFTPWHKFFIPYTIRQYIFAKLPERHILPPWLFAPDLECPLYVRHQISRIDINVFLHGYIPRPRKPTGLGRRIQSLLIGEFARAEQLVRLVHRPHVTGGYTLVASQITYQEKRGLLFQGIPFIKFQHMPQSRILFQSHRTHVFFR